MNTRRRVPQTCRAITLSLFFLAALSWLPKEASSETVKARRTANVYAKAGERSQVVTTVRAGKKMTVLSRKGRWLKVRVNGRAGWIVRTNVETKQARTPKTRTTRRKAFVKGRSRKRDLRRKSAPKDRMGLDATEDLDADEDFGDDDDDDDDFDDDDDDGDDDDDDDDDGDDDDDDDEDDDGDDDDDDDEEGDEEDDEEDDEDELAKDDEESDQEFVVAALDIELRSRKSLKSREVASASAGDRLIVVGRSGDWVEVENSDGDKGWVKKSAIRKPGHAYKKLALVGNAGLGFLFLSQNFTSNGAGEFSEYKIGSKALAIAFGGTALYDYGPKYLLGGDLAASYAISSPGIRVELGDMAQDTGFSVVDVSLAGKGGYKVHAPTGTAVFARLGFRYQAFLIKNVNDVGNKNLAGLPTEALKGPVVGIEVNSAQVIDKVSANFKFDTMLVAASRSQTSGLEDGQTSAAKAIFATLSVVYAYSPQFNIIGGYQYGWASTKWDGREMGSMRTHQASEAKRSDAAHTFSVGATRDF